MYPKTTFLQRLDSNLLLMRALIKYLTFFFCPIQDSIRFNAFSRGLTYILFGDGPWTVCRSWTNQNFRTDGSSAARSWTCELLKFPISNYTASQKRNQVYSIASYLADFQSLNLHSNTVIFKKTSTKSCSSS